jgi:hypothetical protein
LKAWPLLRSRCSVESLNSESFRERVVESKEIISGVRRDAGDNFASQLSRRAYKADEKTTGQLTTDYRTKGGQPLGKHFTRSIRERPSVALSGH